MMSGITQMEALVQQNIREHNLISAGDGILVAVSGGADSTALLHVLWRLSSDLGVRVVAAHLNHGIRSDADADAFHVARLCRALGIACVFGNENVPAYAAGQKMGLEEGGRILRYRFLRRSAHRCGCNRIATAHHLQDQAETLIMRLARGTSTPGLKGIPVCDPPFVRPLLAVERRQVVEYLRRHNLTWVEDETNADSRFTRNLVRHQLMPLLERVHPQAQIHLAHLARQVSLEEHYWDTEVGKVLQHARFGTDETRIPCGVLTGLHPALRIRTLRALLERVRRGLHGLESRHLHLLDSLFTTSRGQMQFDLPGAWVAKRYADVVFRRNPPAKKRTDFLLCIDGPGTYGLPDGSKIILMECTEPGTETPWCVEFDSAQVDWPLHVRNNRPGDRLQCVGMCGSKKLKAVFSERRLEAEERKSVPLLCTHNHEVLWAMGVRRSRLWQCRSDADRVLRVLFTPCDPKI
jgi:tRNA(Ile)-lysidine synthase